MAVAATAPAPGPATGPTQAVTRAEAVVAALARTLKDGDVVATGVASYLPILAIAVARATHAPRLTYLACVGSLDPVLERLHPSAESLTYLKGRAGDVTIPDLFDHARRGRVDVMFFGAAEVDGRGDTNLTAAGGLDRPTYKFPGVAGAGTLRRWVKRPVLLVPRQSQRNLVSRVQTVSTRDHRRPTPLHTDLGVFEFENDKATLVARHDWASEADIAARTGFSYRTCPDLRVLPDPAPDHLDAIREYDPDRLRECMVTP